MSHAPEFTRKPWRTAWGRVAHALRPRPAVSLLALLAALAPAAAAADDLQTTPAGRQDLTELSLDELLQIEVTSVSKRPEKLLDAAAAIYVLSGDEIHRQGARSIAEALRLVPGLEVARVTSRTYAITARGFNNVNADKLLVLLDGRSVYTPLTSAVFWDVLDTYLDDIDRIEVIRGPGAALYGANAVNGVINIVTQHSSRTTGTVVSGGIGTEDRARAELRSGAKFGETGSARFYVKARDQAPDATPSGDDARDSAQTVQGGLRSDWRLPGGQELSVSGDLYNARFNTLPTITPPNTRATTASGHNLVARLASKPDAVSGWSLQAYYDQYRRDIPTLYGERRDTVDLDFQQQFALGEQHTLIYGLGYRRTSDETQGPPDVAYVFLPASRTLNTESLFVQDQWRLLDDALVLTLGTKLEHSDFDALAVQPSLRAGWRVAAHAFTWAAVSRAVRQPNRLNSDIGIYCPPPNGYPGSCGPGLFLIGNPNVASEKLTAYEWGLRVWGRPNLSFDLATFYNRYDQIISSEAATSTTPFGSIDNKLKAQSYGAELVLNWDARPDLNLQFSYGYLRLNATRNADSTDTASVARLEGSDPRHQAGLRLSWQPAQRWHVNSFLRFVDGLSADQVPAYVELNTRIARQFDHGLEVSLSGQNLLNAQHPEFSPVGSRNDVERSGLIGFTWRWQ